MGEETRMAIGYRWPGTAMPGREHHAWVGDPQAPAPPLTPNCVALWLPPTSAAHPDVVRMRAWLDAAAGTPCRAVYRPEAAPGEPLRYRLALSFAHVCRVLGVPAALEVGPAPLPEPLSTVLTGWPDVAVAIRAQAELEVQRAESTWGKRLALVLTPNTAIGTFTRGWAHPLWIVSEPPSIIRSTRPGGQR